MSTFTVVLTDRRDDAALDPETQLCTGVSLREALNAIRKYGVHHTEANLTGVLLKQDGATPKLTRTNGTLFLVVMRYSIEKPEQACPGLLCATREVAEAWVTGEIDANPDEEMWEHDYTDAVAVPGKVRLLYSIIEMPVVSSIAEAEDEPDDEPTLEQEES